MPVRTTRTLIGTREAAQILGVTQGRIRQLTLPSSTGAKAILWSDHIGAKTVVVDKAEVEAYGEDLNERRLAGHVPGPKPKGFQPDRPGPRKAAG